MEPPHPKRLTRPTHSNNLVSGTSFTFFQNGHTKSIEVNVVDPYNVDIGCGRNEDKNLSLMCPSGTLFMAKDTTQYKRVRI